MNRLSENGSIDSILIATDGSDYSAGAIRTGVALAHACGARLIGLSVAVYDPQYSTQVPHLAEVAENYARQALQSFVAVAGEGAETMVVEAGDPYQGILEGAKTRGVDLIVIGRRGRRGLARMMVGDATARVAGKADTNVLVCPRAARLWEKRILLATDGSAHSVAAAGAAGHLAKRFGLPATVISVVTSSQNEARREDARQAVAAALARLESLGVALDGKVVEGRPDEAIVKTAEETGADLIVVGSHGRTGLAKVLLGSVAERVIGQTHCPVLVVKL